MKGTNEYRLYPKGGGLAYQTVRAAGYWVEGEHYVFFDDRRQELCRLPRDEYGGVLCIRAYSEDGPMLTKAKAHP